MELERCGTRIMTLGELHTAALAKKAVICQSGCFSHRPLPAAFIINLTGTVLCRVLENGLYIYNKPTKTKGESRWRITKPPLPRRHQNSA